MLQNFFRSMGLDDLDEDSPSTSTARLPTTSASTSNVCASSSSAATSGTTSSTASKPKMDSSKSMPQLAQVSTPKGAREKEPKRELAKKEPKKDHHGARQKEPKERKETTFKDTPKDRDCESQASFSSKESGPSTTSSCTSKGRSPDHDPPALSSARHRQQQNVFVDWAPAWKGSGGDSASTGSPGGGGGGFRPQWPPVVRDGTSSTSSHPARGSNPAIDALGLGSGRLGSSSSSDGVKPRSRPGHPTPSNLRGNSGGSNSSIYTNNGASGGGGGSPSPSQAAVHRPKSYHPKESRHDKDSGDFYTRNPLDNSGRGGTREGVAVAGGRGQWQGGEVRGQHPSISGT